MDRPIDPEAPDPMRKIWDNFDMISPVKKCPKCLRLTLVFDARTGRLHCTKCDFERHMPQQ